MTKEKERQPKLKFKLLYNRNKVKDIQWENLFGAHWEYMICVQRDVPVLVTILKNYLV